MKASRTVAKTLAARNEPEPDRYGNQADKAYQEILMRIITKRILPGQPVTAAEYAEELHMSRTPVREALVRLKNENLVQIVPRRGAFVRVLTADEVRHNYEIAEALDGMIVYLATPYVTPGAMAALERLMAGMEGSLATESPDIERWVRLDEEFHRTLDSFCDNTYLVENRHAIQSQIIRSRLLRVPSWVDKSKSNEDHRKICAAIEREDVEGARRAMHDHWGRIREEFVRLSRELG